MIICFHQKPKEKDTPRNAYPTKTVKIQEDLYLFDPNKSHIYQLDGEKCEPFEERKLII